MPLAPDAQLVINAMAGMPPLSSVPPAAARAGVIANRPVLEPIPMASVEERVIPGPGGDLTLRIYTPNGRPFGAGPGIVFFHGGGWVICNLDTHDRVARRLADDVGCIVVSVDYRLAPEHKYPAAADDCYTATAWVVAHADELGIDPTRVAVAGDSAGGNLAAVVALMARDRGGPALAFQLLVYPVTGTPWDGRASYDDNAEGYVLTRESMEWFTDLYARSEADRTDPHFAPINAPDLRGLPPAHVVTAEFDPLRDEGEAYAARLIGAGVATTVHRFDGQIHGFYSSDHISRSARAAQIEAAAHVRAALG